MSYAHAYTNMHTHTQVHTHTKTHSKQNTATIQVALLINETRYLGEVKNFLVNAGIPREALPLSNSGGPRATTLMAG